MNVTFRQKLPPEKVVYTNKNNKHYYKTIDPSLHIELKIHCKITNL